MARVRTNAMKPSGKAAHFQRRRGFLKVADKSIDGKGPRVALVIHARLQQSQGADRTGLVNVFEMPGDRHAVRELHHIGQEAADLQFRIDAFADTPVGLEEQPAAQKSDAIAAQTQQFDGIELFGAGRRQLGEGARRHET
jgi:hypothetical protein